jgi:hypothetical protein
MAGRWSENKAVDYRIVLGGLYLAIMFAVLDEANEEISKGLAQLVLIATVLRYTLPILRGTGLVAKR